MKDELVDHIDAGERVLAQVSKHQAHRHGWLHRAVIAEVRDHDGNFVVAKQAPDRQEPGQYVCPVGGHVKSGESEMEALRREAGEEIGITQFDAEFVTRYIFDRHILGRHENHFFIIYRIRVDPTDIELGPEAVDIRVFSPADLAQAIRQTPELFGHSFLDFIQRYYP